MPASCRTAETLSHSCSTENQAPVREDKRIHAQDCKRYQRGETRHDRNREPAQPETSRQDWDHDLRKHNRPTKWSKGKKSQPEPKVRPRIRPRPPPRINPKASTRC